MLVNRLLFPQFVNKHNPCRFDSHRRWLSHVTTCLGYPDFFSDLKIESPNFTSLRHACSDLGIDFDILMGNNNSQPIFTPHPIILRFLDLNCEWNQMANIIFRLEIHIFGQQCYIIHIFQVSINWKQLKWFWQNCLHKHELQLSDYNIWEYFEVQKSQYYRVWCENGLWIMNTH